jgi:orotate phosphoribosyltransferase
MNSKQKLAQQIFTVSHLEGEFRLRSGAVSHEYFDKYLFETDPMILSDISQAMSQLVPTNVDALAGLELGGIPLVTLLSQMTGLPAIFVRKAAKSYGTGKLAEGGEVQGRKLLMVEDVVTSGGQIINSTFELRKLGQR